MKKQIAIALASLLICLNACGKQSEIDTVDLKETATPIATIDTSEAEATNTKDSVAKTPVEQVSEALIESGYTAEVEETKLVDGTDASYGADAMTNLTLQYTEESGQSSDANLFNGIITIFDYTDADAVTKAMNGFDKDDPSQFNMNNGDGTATGVIVDYVAPITLWQLDNSIVLYCGDDAALCGMLTEAFGEPFASNL